MFDLGIVLGLMNPDTSKKPVKAEEKKDVEVVTEVVVLEPEPECVSIEVKEEPAEEVVEESKVEIETEPKVEEPVVFVSKKRGKKKQNEVVL